MGRLLSLTAAGIVIFAGFGIPVLVPGIRGVALGLGVAAIGALLFWFTEKRTRDALDADSGWNRMLKADGDDLVERTRRD